MLRKSFWKLFPLKTFFKLSSEEEGFFSKKFECIDIYYICIGSDSARRFQNCVCLYESYPPARFPFSLCSLISFGIYFNLSRVAYTTNQTPQERDAVVNQIAPTAFMTASAIPHEVSRCSKFVQKFHATDRFKK